MQETWFKKWFNTSYYHILYKNRNDEEAQLFIDKLIEKLNLSNEYCLDLACGKGRHAVYLNKKGLNVVGLDLSEESIASASEFENDTLFFDTHDMREVYKNEKFDVIFNLFTSFGYFDDEADNARVLNSVSEMLTADGRLVIDFMNATKVVNCMQPFELKKIDGIEFNISKEYTGTHILKHIAFKDNGEDYKFTEEVQALRVDDFKKLLERANFNLDEIYGDFDLSRFNENTSDRLIIIASKK